MMGQVNQKENEDYVYIKEQISEIQNKQKKILDALTHVFASLDKIESNQVKLSQHLRHLREIEHQNQTIVRNIERRGQKSWGLM